MPVRLAAARASLKLVIHSPALQHCHTYGSAVVRTPISGLFGLSLPRFAFQARHEAKLPPGNVHAHAHKCSMRSPRHACERTVYQHRTRRQQTKLAATRASELAASITGRTLFSSCRRDRRRQRHRPPSLPSSTPCAGYPGHRPPSTSTSTLSGTICTPACILPPPHLPP